MPPKRKSSSEHAPTTLKKAKTSTKSAPAKKAPVVKKDLSLDIPSHVKIFKRYHSALKKAVREDWHDGYDDHMEIQIELVDAIANWMTEIFQSAVKPGERIAEAYEALLMAEHWMQKERANEFNVRVDWREGDSEWTVDDVDGAKVYKGFPEKILTKMWRDLALKAIVTKDVVTLNDIIAHCYEQDTTKKEHKKDCFGDEPVDCLFALQGQKLIEYNAKAEASYNRMDELSKKFPGYEALPRGPTTNINCEGYPVEDEWYADDLAMQAAREELKTLLNYKQK